MRVLWLTNTPSCYQPVGKRLLKGHYNGGGWISSAEKALADNDSVTLAVSFILDGQPKKAEQGRVTYYPVKSQGTNRLLKIKDKLMALFMKPETYETLNWPFFLEQFRRIIEDFKPEIIHVWGSEQWFGLVWKVTDVPVILHLQGIINPYRNAFLFSGVSWREMIKGQKGLMEKMKARHMMKKWQGAAYREKEIFKGVTACLGRTNWDRRVAYCLNQKARYYHVDEILRRPFYEAFARDIPTKLTIITTISSPPYKGYDLVLKTAKLLKENLGMEFVWNCYGNIEPRFVEKSVGICHTNVNVNLMGVATSEQLRMAELSATLYFHSSYIDNSPNSLCEAQMLGLPVVSTNVGGIPSLVSDGEDGFLIPSNDPYQAAFLIKYLNDNPDVNLSMGERGRCAAIKRHGTEHVLAQIKDAYVSVLSNV